jgi:hypothetical protein
MMALCGARDRARPDRSLVRVTAVARDGSALSRGDDDEHLLWAAVGEPSRRRVLDFIRFHGVATPRCWRASCTLHLRRYQNTGLSSTPLG